MADRKAISLDDVYEVKTIDKDGNHFDKGAHFACSSPSFARPRPRPLSRPRLCRLAFASHIHLGSGSFLSELHYYIRGVCSGWRLIVMR